jgi:hypothetical protein
MAAASGTVPDLRPSAGLWGPGIDESRYVVYDLSCQRVVAGEDGPLKVDCKGDIHNDRYAQP